MEEVEPAGECRPIPPPLPEGELDLSLTAAPSAVFLSVLASPDPLLLPRLALLAPPDCCCPDEEALPPEALGPPPPCCDVDEPLLLLPPSDLSRERSCVDVPVLHVGWGWGRQDIEVGPSHQHTLHHTAISFTTHNPLPEALHCLVATPSPLQLFHRWSACAVETSSETGVAETVDGPAMRMMTRYGQLLSRRSYLSSSDGFRVRYQPGSQM